MDHSSYTPERINTAKWYEHTRTWGKSLFYDAEASINPETAKANQASDWKIEIKLGNMVLEAGDHVAVEVNVTWATDRGRPFTYGRLAFQEEWNPGYGASPKVEMPEGVEYRLAITEPARMNRYFIIDLVLTRGSLRSGETFSISLADPDGSLIRCPWYAQVFPIPVAFRKKNDMHYMRIREIPYLKVVASEPKFWKIAATLQPGQKQALVRAIAADGINMNPAHNAPDPVVLEGSKWIIEKMEKHMGYNGAALWKGIAQCQDSDSNADCLELFNREAGLYGRSNSIKALYEGMQVYFGDLHGQSDRSIGFGSETEYFSWARDAELLDFVAPANHYGGRENVTSELWDFTLHKCDEFNKTGEFVTLYSYEWGGGLNAHRNVYYEKTSGGLFDAHDEKYNRIDELWKVLDLQGVKALTVPHHPKFIGRIDWAEFNPKYQRLVEVCSCWGNSETGGPHSVQAALDMGHRLGVVGGTDTHFSQPGRSGFGPFDLGGITGVICSSLERGAIWNALHDRRCYATTGERILLSFNINGEIMGSELKKCNIRAINGKVIGTSRLESVEIVRNGKVLKCFEMSNSNALEFSVEDTENFDEIALQPKVDMPGKFVYYYLRVKQSDGHWAMSSPIWVS